MKTPKTKHLELEEECNSETLKQRFKPSLDEQFPWTCILNPLLPELIPNGKDFPIYTSWGKFHMDLPHITEMWSAEVHQDSDIGSATSSCTLDIDCVRLTPVSCHRFDSTKPLVLFYSPTERVPETRPVLVSMESRSTTRRWLSWSLSNRILHSSHSHSLSHLVSTGQLIMSCLVVFDFWGYKLI